MIMFLADVYPISSWHFVMFIIMPFSHEISMICINFLIHPQYSQGVKLM